MNEQPDRGPFGRPADAFGTDGLPVRPDGGQRSAFEVVRSREDLRRRTRETLADATEEAFVILPAGAFAALADDLADAVDRDVFVYLLLAAPEVGSVYADVENPGEYAHVVRTWDSRPPVFVVGDEQYGVLASYGMIQGSRGDDYAIAFDQDEIASGFYGNYLSNVWPMAEQRYVAGPPPLPETFTEFRNGVTTAALHTTAGYDVVADIEATDVESGDDVSLENAAVREVRQNLVEPANVAFPLENALIVETADGLASVGGQSTGIGPYYEEYAADEVTLRRA